MQLTNTGYYKKVGLIYVFGFYGKFKIKKSRIKCFYFSLFEPLVAIWYFINIKLYFCIFKIVSLKLIQ